MRGWGVRISRCAALVISCAFILSGCASVFQNFSELESPYIYNLPASEVANQVRCELYFFAQELAKNPDPPRFHLDQNEKAEVKLQLQTDAAGYVSYVGIDLKKAGFTSLADLVATNSKTPSLSAKINAKGSVAATVTMSVAQKTTDPETIAKCEELKHSASQIVKNLYLKEWLSKFFKTLDEDKSAINGIGVKSVALSTAFTIGLDVSTGLNPFFGTAYVLPISGLNIDINPQFIHKLDINLVVCEGASCKDKNSITADAIAKALAKRTKMTAEGIGDSLAKKLFEK